MARQIDVPAMSLYEKIQAIVEAADILEKDKSGYGYNYVSDEEILSKVGPALKKYHVLLIPSLVPGTFSIEPWSYTKFDKGSKTDKTIWEVLVKAECVYTWINVDKPEERIQIPWAITASMEDPSQAFGSALTYSQRQFWMKSLGLPTTEDVDAFRSKQREAEMIEERLMQEQLKAAKKEVTNYGTKLIKAGIKKEDIYKIVAQFNGGEENPSSIKDLETCNLVMEAFKKLEK